jgi:hypothetical protein
MNWMLENILLSSDYSKILWSELRLKMFPQLWLSNLKSPFISVHSPAKLRLFDFSVGIIISTRRERHCFKTSCPAVEAYSWYNFQSEMSFEHESDMFRWAVKFAIDFIQLIGDRHNFPKSVSCCQSCLATQKIVDVIATG